MLNCTKIYTGAELNALVEDCELGDDRAAQDFAKLLPEMEDVSVIDPLNEAFLNEHSVVAPQLLMKGSSSESMGASQNKVVREVKANFANLDMHNQGSFSITEMLEQQDGRPGRKTHKVEKAFFQAPISLTNNADEEEKHNQ